MAQVVNTDVVVPCGADRARHRLDDAFGCDAEHRVVLTVGPRHRRWPRKHVQTRLTDPHEVGRTAVSGLRWEPTGRFHRLFPTLDAGLALTTIDDTSCLLSIAGAYRPPLGRLGRMIDRMFLHRLATSTTTDFADRLARALAHDPKERLP
jgi:hypothetical protein